MSGLAACLGLFSSALIASTLFPAQSELVLAGLLIAGKQPAWLLIVVATVGNVLGSAINWWLGRNLEQPLVERLCGKPGVVGLGVFHIADMLFYKRRFIFKLSPIC